MKRLKGVHATQADAMTYLRDFSAIQHNFINDPKVMMYLGPSCLQQAKKNKSKGNAAPSDRDKILAFIKERKSKNVGFVYKQSWEDG